MSEFINTADVIGDEEMCAQIIQRTVTEYKENRITKVGPYALAHCTKLTKVDVPNVTFLDFRAFFRAAISEPVVFENVTSGVERAFGPASCPRVTFPRLTNFQRYFFDTDGSDLPYIDLHVATSIGTPAFQNSTLNTLIIRTPSVCTISDIRWRTTPYIYVPRALVDSYKAATNWSAYADYFRALEDYTVDGTIMGKFAAGSITYNLTGISSSNSEVFVLNSSYQTTLAAWGDNASVTITMDGVDVTSEVYNAETGEVTIPKVAGDVVITASADIEALMIPTWYSLPEPTTFNGSSDYIDTGVKLFDTAKNFTIIIDATFDRLASDKCLFHCMNEANPYPGISIDGNTGVRICYTGSSSLTTTITPVSNVSVLALRYTAGKLDRIRYKNAAGQIVSQSIAGTPTYTAISQTLLLGAYQQTNGTKGRFFNGTINDFRLYDVALDDDVIDILLTAI